jgi:hypothetical protein
MSSEVQDLLKISFGNAHPGHRSRRSNAVSSFKFHELGQLFGRHCTTTTREQEAQGRLLETRNLKLEPALLRRLAIGRVELLLDLLLLLLHLLQLLHQLLRSFGAIVLLLLLLRCRGVLLQGGLNR